jgi:hypothetical protein
VDDDRGRYLVTDQLILQVVFWAGHFIAGVQTIVFHVTGIAVRNVLAIVTSEMKDKGYCHI